MTENQQSHVELSVGEKEETSGRTYIAIDLKSFYASVECSERHLDPLTTNLVVADPDRTEKTICLAVSPALKTYGIPGRARLFEVVQKVAEVNAQRLQNAIQRGIAIRVTPEDPYIEHQPEIAENGKGKRKKFPAYRFASASFDANALEADPSLELTYLIAPPRMALYMEYSARIYSIYLRYVSSEDIYVYSVDECFIDVTPYLRMHGNNARELCMAMIQEVFSETGITATGGIGSNLYLAKVAMDIVAKHMPPDKNGVRIAELDERSYREKLWPHQPLTDFWRIGRHIAEKLEKHGLYTMGDVARCSLSQDPYWGEEMLYQLFGINAELLIDHAWGWEPCTIAEIKQYQPSSSSVSTGQVLPMPYDSEKGRLIVKEMADLLVLDLVKKDLVTDQIILTVNYDSESLKTSYSGPVIQDWYGRTVPKQAHGSINLGEFTSSSRLILEKMTELYERIIDPNLLIRRVYVVANHTISESGVIGQSKSEQVSFFVDPEEQEAKVRARQEEKALQKAVLSMKQRFGKNAVMKGMNLEKGGTTIERNAQIGGHKA